MSQPVNDDLIVLPPVADDPVFGDPLPGAAGNASRVLGADPHDFAGLFIRHKWSFQLHARRFLNDQRDIDEVVQEGFLKLFLALPELETELQALAYARRTITNLCIDRYRADQRRPRLVDLESVPVDSLLDDDDTDPLVQAEDAAIVREALAMLSPLHRDALVKREIEEKPLPQIAAELDIPVEQVKHVLHRARRSLRRLLVGTYVQPGVDLDLAVVLEANRARAARAAKPTGAAVLVILMVLAGLAGVVGMRSGGRGAGETAKTLGIGPVDVPGDPVAPRTPQDAPPVAPAPGTPAPGQSAPSAGQPPTSTPAATPVRPARGSSSGDPAPAPPTPTADQGPVPAPVAVPAPVPPVAGPGAGPGTGPGKGESFTYEGNLLAVGAPRIDDQVRLPKAGGYSSTSVLTVPTVAGQLALRQTYTADASGQNGDFSVAPELRGAAGSVAFPAALTVTTLGRTATNEVHLLAEATLGPAEGAGCVPELRHLTVDLTYDKDLVGVTSEAVRLVATDAGAASTGCPQPSVPPSASPPAIAAPDDAAPPASDSKEAGASAAPSGTSSEPRE